MRIEKALDLDSLSQIIRFYVCNLFCLFVRVVYFNYFYFFIFFAFLTDLNPVK